MRRTSSYSVADTKNNSEGGEAPSNATLKRYKQLRVSGKLRGENAEIEEHEGGDIPAEMVTDFSSQKNGRPDKGNAKRTTFSRRFSEPGKVVMATGQLFRRTQSQVDQTMLNKQILQREGGRPFMFSDFYS
ncbi:uncharacterized protein LOC144625227 [Crassostrea virginica]